MRIAEFFQSIQGEGELAGTPSVFVRTTGCNLRCWFCDTPYTSWEPEGTHEPWPELAERILACDCQHVVITGGEPMLQPDVVPLTERLARAGRLVTIETAGTVHRPVQAALMSISPKRPNSTPTDVVWSSRHEVLRDRTDVVTRMTREYRYQLKYVVDSPADVVDVEGHVAQIGGVAPKRVFLMPQGTDATALRDKMQWLGDEAARRGYSVSPRLHIELFGNRRGT
jgi:7-carboxy-7-deazaguanine synthase